MVPQKAFAAAIVALTLTPCFVRPASAQATRPRINFATATATAAATAAASAATPVRGDGTRATAPDPEKRRPSIVMTSLYSATALVQGLDAHSTLKAIHAGATERNPLMHALTAHPPVFVALKAGAAAGLIFAGQRLAKHNKMHAIIAMVAIDSTYAFIAAHNYKVAARLR